MSDEPNDEAPAPAVVTAVVTGHAVHPPDLTPAERAHLTGGAR